MQLKPDIYQKDIYHINYDSLYQKGIRFLIFDLDNTVAALDEKIPSVSALKLFSKLKTRFSCLLLSNSLKKRVKPFGEALGIPYLSCAMKPISFRLKHYLRKEKISLNQVAIVGDQFMTDMVLGKKLGIVTIFVDVLAKKDYKITGFNRYREKKIIDQYEQNHLFERGKYYE